MANQPLFQPRGDQAEGLRKLFASNPLRVVSFIAAEPGVGKTTLLANLAVCLARHGMEVLILDENAGSDNVASQFGLRAEGDLWQVMNRKLSLREVIAAPCPGVGILPAAKAVERLGGLSAWQQEAMLEAIQGQLVRPVDVLLVDAGYQHSMGYSPLGLAADEKVLVAQSDEQSLKRAYALLKYLSQTFGRKRFRMVLNRARHVGDAKAVCGNMADLLAKNRLGKLLSANVVPYDLQWNKPTDSHIPQVTELPTSEAALSMRELAHDLLHWPFANKTEGGLLQFIQKLLAATERLGTVSTQPTHV